jgi:hypothetical protein
MQELQLLLVLLQVQAQAIAKYEPLQHLRSIMIRLLYTSHHPDLPLRNEELFPPSPVAMAIATRMSALQVLWDNLKARHPPSMPKSAFDPFLQFHLLQMHLQARAD